MTGKYRSTLDYLERGSGPLWLERCIERSPDFGKPPVEQGQQKKINKGVCGTTRAIGMTIARCANNTTKGFEGLWVAFPSHETIARAAYFSEDTVERAIDTLAKAGFITVVPRDGRGSNYYVFNTARLRAEAIVVERAEDERKRQRREAAKAARDQLKASMRTPGLESGDALDDDIDEDDFNEPYIPSRRFQDALSK